MAVFYHCGRASSQWNHVDSEAGWAEPKYMWLGAVFGRHAVIAHDDILSINGQYGLITPMKFPFKTIALIGKYKTPEITESVLRLAAFLSGKGITVVVDALTAEHIKENPYRVVPLGKMEGVVDLSIVLGGDGTMLNIARTLAPFGIPLVGVNQGRLGFLTDISLDTMQQTIEAILEGKFVTEQRMLLTTRVLRAGKEIYYALALNEVTVHRDNAGSMIEFEVRIDGEYL